MTSREMKYWGIRKWRYAVQNDGEINGLKNSIPIWVSRKKLFFRSKNDN